MCTSESHGWLEREQKKKKRKTNTFIRWFAMVFPPLQEATSFVVRPSPIRLYEPFSPCDIVWDLHSKLWTDRLVNLYPKHCNLQRIETTNSITFSKQYESRWLHFDSVTVMNLTGWAGGDTSYYTVSTQFKSNSLFISTSKNKRVMHCVIKSTTTLYLLWSYPTFTAPHTDATDCKASACSNVDFTFDASQMFVS